MRALGILALSACTGGTADTLLRSLGVRTERDEAIEESLTFVDASEEMESSASWGYWIPARRRDDDQAPELKPPVFLSGVGDSVLQLHSGIPTPFLHQLAELDDYNREFARLTERGELAQRDSLLGSLPADLQLQDRAVLNDIDVEYGKADALAVHFQRRSDRLFKYFSLSTVAMAVAFLSYERISETPLLLYSYLLFMVSGMGLYLALHGKRWFGCIAAVGRKSPVLLTSCLQMGARLSSHASRR